jgi:hypothetical protein
MTYPKVNVRYQSGALGGVADINDGVAGLIIGCDITLATEPSLEANKVYTLNSLVDAKDFGFNQIPYAYAQISEFYKEAGTGAKLHVYLVAETETLAEITDKAADPCRAKNFLEKANDAKFWGVCRKPAAGYSPTTTDGIDDDVTTAIANANLLNEDFAALQRPMRAIVEGRGFGGDVLALKDLRSSTDNRAAGVITSGDAVKNADATAASVGLVLGRLAGIPVQRKISRVKDGKLTINAAFLSDGTAIEDNDVKSISEKGWIVTREFIGKDGYFFADDPLATEATDDYSNISYGRTIDKVHSIAYDVFVDEIDDEVLVDAEGKIDAAVAKELEGKIDNAVNTLMTANDELSGFSAFVSTDQDIITTGKIQIAVKPQPVGYSRIIEVLLGFSKTS